MKPRAEQEQFLRRIGEPSPRNLAGVAGQSVPTLTAIGPLLDTHDLPIEVNACEGG